jgi:DNA-binding HxlR family transcriptional regulator
MRLWPPVLAFCRWDLAFGSRGTTEDSALAGGDGKGLIFMAKASTARDERYQRSREASLAGAPSQPREAVPADLDRLIHERVRLGIVSALAVNRSLTFNELKAMLKTTDGNLSVHARKLEEADYIVCTKSFDGRLPKTEYRLAAAGRRALERYLNHMEALIRATREG